MAKFNYTVEIKENDEWKLYMQWARPFVDKETLDESLDEGVIRLWQIGRKECFKPFLPVRIRIYETNGLDNIENLSETERATYLVDTIYRLTTNCTVEQKAFAYKDGENRYTHTLNLIELSKLLEREICDTMTFTNYLGRDYIQEGGEKIEPVFAIEQGNGADQSSYVNKVYLISPIYQNTEISLPSCESAFDITFTATSNIAPDKSKFQITLPSGEIKEFSYSNGTRMLLKDIGEYTVKYFVGTRLNNGTGKLSVATFTYTIAVLKDESIKNKPIFSLSKTISRILSCGTTRRNGLEQQRYVLKSEVLEKYSNIQSPEFHITRCTLWEALSQIGGYIHAIPRLIWNEQTNKPDTITFDELGGNSEYTRSESCKILAYSSNRNVDEACGAIDSTVENLLNTREKLQGSVSEPFSDGFQTVRSESVEISTDKGVVKTQYPIYRLEKLESIYNGEIADLTAYVYESSEYGTLSAYGSTYPYSTAYALKYSQGDKLITNLSYKQDTEDPADEILKTIAIKNIYKRLGKECPTNLTELAFRVTYIPMVNLRAIAKKTYKDNAYAGNTLLYNQSANTVESESYGENLKGTIARLGNGEETVTFIVEKYSDLPKVGQLYEGKYIACVTKEYELNQIKITVLLVENFNRLAQYLGIFTNYRLFDVSEKQSVQRYISYGENVEIGDSQNQDVVSGITTAGIQCFQKLFTQNAVSDSQVSVTLAKGDELKQVSKSCIGVALGNSLAFNWGYEDNFSAGSKSVTAGAKRASQLVAYGNVYGEIRNLSLKLFNKLGSSFNKDESDNLPEYSGNYEGALFDYSTYPLIVQKDSRECLNVTTQLHFIANRQSIVIGSQLAQNNPLVTQCNADKATRLYLLPYTLNELNLLFDLRQGYKMLNDVGSLISWANDRTFYINSFANSTVNNYKAWAFMEEIKDTAGNMTGFGKLYIGENIDLAPNATSSRVYFNFISNKEKSI